MSSRKATRKKPQSRIVSYNLLSSSLCSPGYFTSCKPECCDTDYRLERILEKLNTEIDSQSIICLQEVSHKFAGELHTHFSQNDYYFVHALYGNKFNGYMGVGIAVPMAKFTIEEVDITKIADTKRTPPKSKYSKPSFLQGLYTSLMKMVEWFLKLVGAWKEAVNVWDKALWRNNQMLCLRLSFKHTKNISDKSPFVVGTYHMPCMFDQPQVMNIHCALSAQHIQKFAKELPFVYCGDFNIKPESSMYQLLTTGAIEESNPERPVALEGDESGWAPTVSPALQSAYKDYNGREPDFTNYAKVKDDPVFQDTLDYIFLSPGHWQVDDVEPLPHRSEVKDGPFPNEREPSDHVLIAANLVMQ